MAKLYGETKTHVRAKLAMEYVRTYVRAYLRVRLQAFLLHEQLRGALFTCNVHTYVCAKLAPHGALKLAW